MTNLEIQHAEHLEALKRMKRLGHKHPKVYDESTYYRRNNACRGKLYRKHEDDESNLSQWLKDTRPHTQPEKLVLTKRNQEMYLNMLRKRREVLEKESFFRYLEKRRHCQARSGEHEYTPYTSATLNQELVRDDDGT